MIAHVADALRPEVASLAVVGRDWGGLARIDDLPRPGLGPLGGLAGALAHARAHGHAAVLSAPCDTLGLPAGLAARLAPAPAVAAGHWLVGLWPAALAESLIAFLAAGHSLRARDWAAQAGARHEAIAGLVNWNGPPMAEGGPPHF
jgi:molybdopterin-guanine dinucleotide biosynthesis protein A